MIVIWALERVLLLIIKDSIMTNLITKIEILGKKPSQISDFMLSLNKEKYLNWHPEHKDFAIIKQTENILGTVFYFHEKMDKLTVKYKWEVVEFTQNHKVVMKAKYFIPVYLILTFDDTENGTLVTHDLQLGYKKKITGLVDWIIKTFVFTKSKEFSNERHAIEEFKNLEKIIQ